jgi:hypothetical protein
MTMKKLLCVCAALLLGFSGVTAFAAATMTGKWTGDMKTADGSSYSLTFTFTQDGAKLTGTVAGPQGDPLPISDGKIADDKFSFSVAFNGMTIKHEGTINGDEIKMSTKSDQADFPGGEMTLKRAK